MYIGKLKQSTMEERIKTYLANNGITGEIESEELPTKDSIKAYKVAIPITKLKKIEDPQFWPGGVVVRRYRFRRRE